MRFKHVIRGNGLNLLWRSLSDHERRAVAEACYAFDNQFDAGRFEAKYGKPALLYKLPEDHSGGYYSYKTDEKSWKRLKLFLFEQPRGLLQYERVGSAVIQGVAITSTLAKRRGAGLAGTSVKTIRSNVGSMEVTLSVADPLTAQGSEIPRSVENCTA